MKRLFQTPASQKLCDGPFIDAGGELPTAATR